MRWSYETVPGGARCGRESAGVGGDEMLGGSGSCVEGLVAEGKHPMRRLTVCDSWEESCGGKFPPPRKLGCLACLADGVTPLSFPRCPFTSHYGASRTVAILTPSIGAVNGGSRLSFCLLVF